MGAAATPLALGAANAGLGVSSSIQQNRAVRRSSSAARGAADVELGQLADTAALEIRKREAESQAVRARLRVLAADSGLSSGSFDALERQVDIDEEINKSIIDRNLYNQRRRTLSELQARLVGLSGEMSNPFVTGFQGGLQGYQTGLQIQNSLESMRPPAAPSGPTTATLYD